MGNNQSIVSGNPNRLQADVTLWDRERSPNTQTDENLDNLDGQDDYIKAVRNESCSICFDGAEYEVCGDGCCLLRSIIGELDHFKVPSVIFTSDGKRYRVIGIVASDRADHKKSHARMVEIANIISFDESSEITLVPIMFINKCQSLFFLPPLTKRVLQSTSYYDTLFSKKNSSKKYFPKIVSDSSDKRFVSTPDCRVILNHFPLEIAYQHSSRRQCFIRESIRFVGNYSFSMNNSIVSVVFPSSVESIGAFSFYKCDNLRFIRFKNNSKLRVFEDGSFQSTAVESVDVPSSVEEIGHFAFRNCRNLRSITFQEESQLMIINYGAFSNCVNLRSIAFQEDSLLVVICTYAFYKCKNLRSITFHDDSKLQTIDDNSFEKSSIEYMDFPSSVKKIGNSAFSNCKNLKSITFHEDSKLETIGICSFGSTAIESIDIPSSVKKIGKSAFSDCKNLRSITFHEDSKLETIGKRAFESTAIESVEIPSSVEEIKNYLFCDCKNLRSVKFHDGSKLRIIRRYSFESTAIESIDIPPSVEFIENCAFNLCKNLSSVQCLNREKIKNFKNGFVDCPKLLL